jgi:uncharacterized protein
LRVVLDTNVLVPFTWRLEFDEGPILKAWEEGIYELVLSQSILSEIEDVLSRPRIMRRNGWSIEQNWAFLRTLREDGTLVAPSRLLNVVRDEDDNRFIEVAVAGEADYVVTLDDDLLALGEFEGIQIVTPGRFLAILLDARL